MLPLLDLLHCLRAAGLPLGLEEYIALVKALQRGHGVPDRNALVRLCKLLWAKSRNDEYIVDTYLDLLLAGESIAALLQGDINAILRDSSIRHPDHTRNSSGSPTQDNIIETQEIQTQRISISLKPIHSDVMARRHFLHIPEFFPVTSREMKHVWRTLKRMRRSGCATELDIEATVNTAADCAFYVEPILKPGKANHLRLVLLIDHEGSMTPFHMMTSWLNISAEREFRPARMHTFYFHDWPSDYVYRDKGHTEPESLPYLISTTCTDHTAILIISDAGAARGRSDTYRVQETIKLIEQLQQRSQRIAWLNPVPCQRWIGTSAAQIAEAVGMHEFNRTGLKQAIRTLRSGNENNGWRKK